MDLRYKEFRYEQQPEITKALIDTLLALKTPEITSYHLHKHLWLKLENYICLDSTRASRAFVNKRNKKCARYIDFIIAKFPTLFHEAYCYGTKKMGLSESTKNLCKCMIQYAKKK